MQRRDVYMNHKQQQIFYANARDVRLLAARRFGKTDGSIGPRIYTVSMSMPRGTNLWLGNSRKQLYTRTVPGTIAAIERFFGLREGEHFGWGRPPRWVPKPILQPKTWDNVIWFANGSIWQLISLAVSGSANSITANSIVADECKFMSKSKIDGEVMPALSGITHPLADPAFSESNPLYKSTFFASDASLTAKGNWLEKEEDKLDLELTDGIFKGKTYRDIQNELTHYADRVIYFNELLRNAKATGREVMVVRPEKRAAIQALAAQAIAHEGPFKIIPRNWKNINKSFVDMLINYKLIDPNDAEMLFNHEYLITPDEHFELSMLRNSKKYARHINDLRCNAFAFYRASTFDNIDLIGADYIVKMKRDLPPVVFAISIGNMKAVKSNDGFYSNLDIEHVHGYIPDDCPAIENAMHLRIASTVSGGCKIDTEYETPDFRELQEVKDCTLDGDVIENQPLFIAFDFNANINWVVAGQLYKRDGVDALNVVSSMFVKNERKLRELLQDWNKYYTPHRSHCKEVFFFYDSTAKFKVYAVQSEDYKDTIIADLTKYGWTVHPIDMGSPMQHEQKYKEINECLAGAAYPAVRFNRDNNEALIVALQTAEVSIGYKGFRKDKSGEKLSEEADDAVRLEYRTDGTDAFDTLLIGVKRFLYRMSGMCFPSGTCT